MEGVMAETCEIEITRRLGIKFKNMWQAWILKIYNVWMNKTWMTNCNCLKSWAFSLKYNK